MFSSAIGLVIQAILAQKFGVGNDMDLYLLALSVPIFTVAVIASAYAYGIVPQLVGIKNEADRVALNQGVILFSLMVSSLFVLLSFSVKFQLSLYSNSNITILEEHQKLFKLAWLLGACQIMLTTFGTILTAEKRYLSAIFLQISPQIGLLCFLLFFNDEQKIVYVIMGSLSGCLVGLGISLFGVGKNFTKITKMSLKDLFPLIKKITLKAIFGAVATSVFGVYVIVDAIMAPFEGSGTLASLAYAQKIVIGFGNIAVMGVFTVAAPQLKEILVSQGPVKFAAHARQLVGHTLSFSLIVAVGLYFFANDFLDIFFKSETFLDADVTAVTLLVRAMLPGMVAMLISAVLFKALFCLKKIAYVSILLGLFWPMLYYASIILIPSDGAIKFSQGYSITWLIFLIVLVRYLVLRMRNEVNIAVI